jgi:hypothetical protein
MLTFVLRKFILYVLGRNVGGGWAGNDTTWRMSMDIARILKHADRTGELCCQEKRKMIEFIDGIVGGEGQGPLRPTARRVGFVSYSEDVVAGDYVAACFMGLNPTTFPVIQRAFSLATFGLTGLLPGGVSAIVNGVRLDHADLAGLRLPRFEMPAGWQGAS